jgi:hypothetical protein
MREMNLRYKQITVILLYGFTIILLIDYVLANGGYHTILPAYHPIMVGFSSILIISLLIWNLLKAVEAAAKRQWVKSLIIILCLAILFFGTKITVKILAERSEKRAFELVELFFAQNNTTNFDVEIREEVEQNYRFFLSHYDPSAIQLLLSSPPYGRYDYLVTPKGTTPFMLTLWVSDHGGSILITKQWYKPRIKKE